MYVHVHIGTYAAVRRQRCSARARALEHATYCTCIRRYAARPQARAGHGQQDIGGFEDLQGRFRSPHSAERGDGVPEGAASRIMDMRARARARRRQAVRKARNMETTDGMNPRYLSTAEFMSATCNTACAYVYVRTYRSAWRIKGRRPERPSPQPLSLTHAVTRIVYLVGSKSDARTFPFLPGTKAALPHMQTFNVGERGVWLVLRGPGPACRRRDRDGPDAMGLLAWPGG